MRNVDLESSWAEIFPVLNIVFESPTQTDGGDVSFPAARLSYPQYIGAYTAVYNFCTGEKDKKSMQVVLRGRDLYQRMDEYINCVLNVVLSRINSDANDGGKLLRRYLLEFAGYHRALNVLAHIFMYMERNFVRLEMERAQEGRLDVNVKKQTGVDGRIKVLLAKWNFSRRASAGQLRAGAEVNCVIGVCALGLQRWREKVFNELVESKDRPAGGRIDMALKGLLNIKEDTNRPKLLVRLHNTSLEEVGVKSEHPFTANVTKALDKADKEYGTLQKGKHSSEKKRRSKIWGVVKRIGSLGLGGFIRCHREGNPGSSRVSDRLLHRVEVDAAVTRPNLRSFFFSLLDKCRLQPNRKA